MAPSPQSRAAVSNTTVHAAAAALLQHRHARGRSGAAACAPSVPHPCCHLRRARRPHTLRSAPALPLAKTVMNGFLGVSLGAQNGGQRVATVLIYLNDVSRGGCTTFPRIGLSISPKRGMVSIGAVKQNKETMAVRVIVCKRQQQASRNVRHCEA
jgi:hypothetical protein